MGTLVTSPHNQRHPSRTPQGGRDSAQAESAAQSPHTVPLAQTGRSLQWAARSPQTRERWVKNPRPQVGSGAGGPSVLVTLHAGPRGVVWPGSGLGRPSELGYPRIGSTFGPRKQEPSVFVCWLGRAGRQVTVPGPRDRQASLDRWGAGASGLGTTAGV